MKLLVASLWLGVLLAPTATAQERSTGSARRALLQRLPGARLQEPPPGRSATVLYGDTLAQGGSALESATALLERTRAALGIDEGALALATSADGLSIRDVGLDRASGAPRFHLLRFDQVQDGLPVFRAGVGVLVRAEPGYPVVLSSFDLKDVAGVDTSAARVPGALAPTPGMHAAVGRLLDQQLLARGIPQRARPEALEISAAELVVYAGLGEAVVPPTLALKFVATRGSVLADAARFQRHLVVAALATGEVLLAEDQVQQIDVVGTVSGRATQGLNALECDPEAVVPLPYAEATVVGGNTVFADANGQFVIPHGGSTSVTVRSRLRGQWFEVFDDTALGATPELTTVVTPPGPANFVHNPAPGAQFSNAGVNAYLEANFVRDYVLSYAPAFPTIGTQTFFNLVVNEDSAFGITSCNAVYTGTDLVFWRNSGGCNNTAFTDVVYHEYGHHLIAVTGNGQGQLGEGSGDVMGVLIQDEPVLGQGFSTCGVGIRNANNNHQYPCNGGSHDCGQLISGAVWSLRNELVVTEPVDYRDIGADLFINMLIVRGGMLPGDGTIDPLITVIYLTLDDDDADIGNGTPHYPEIAAGFGDHNLDAPPLDLLDFAYPSGRPEVLDPRGTLSALAVSAVNATPVPQTGTLYLDRGAGVEVFPLAEVAPDLYQLAFPPLSVACGSTVTYYVGAEASTGQMVLDPPGAPDVRYQAIVASATTLIFEDDFEASLGWTVNGTATAGQWQRGIPVGGGDRGDPPTDADGSSRCYLTGNTDGDSDVDGGVTRLLSPVLDASGPGSPLVAYWRWYSNNTGTATDDTFVVEISNNGGSTWSPLETVAVNSPEASGGWYEKVFRIADHIAPTSTMRLRFTASDLGTGSIVEAGIDHVRILKATCDPRRVLPSAPPPPVPVSFP
ncbi:MAG TPA: hypothetical protein VF530_06530 [Planctomycetota bacterium]